LRFLRLAGILLLVAFGIGTVISLILPDKQRIERTIEINAPVTIIYQHLKKLENVDDWAIWQSRDSIVKTTISGTDGTPGSSMKWSGDPYISGKGEIAIASLRENEKIIHNIVFESPKKGNAESEFMFTEKNGKTILHWEFDMATPRPKNIFNLFSSLDKTMGPDFEQGLRSIKAIIEKSNTAHAKSNSYEVKQMNFASTTFAAIRQKIRQADIGSFYAVHLPEIYNATLKEQIPPGMPAGLIYSWETLSQETDYAVGVIVPENSQIAGPLVQAVEIPASKAIYADYFGAYDKLKDAYNSLEQYLASNKLKRKLPIIEFYITNPSSTDTASWHTQVIFLVE
jgi:effector-binding domain-containing protein